MAKPAATKEEIEAVAKRLIGAFKDGSVKGALATRTAGKGMLFSPQLLGEVEAVQRDLFTEWGYAPKETLQNLQAAVRKYPELRPTILELCDVEESTIEGTQEELAKANNINLDALRQNQRGADGAHGHSHNGVPCHGHGGHGGHGGHSHSHGGSSHGHSHNGVPCHGHGHGAGGPPGSMVQQQITMQLVQRGIPPEQMAMMQRLQMKMMSGQQPTGEEQLQAMQVQQRMSQKIAQMTHLVAQGMEALDDADRERLLAIEAKVTGGGGLTDDDRKVLEEAKENIAMYIATMGPMLMQMRQQQQQQQSQQQQAAAAPKPAADTPSQDVPSTDKKKD